MPATMLSYRHAFHAGNFADVIKHVVLVAVLRYMTRKASPLCYIDTHAGAGAYDLHAGSAEKTREADLGIARIRDAGDAPGPVAAYLDLLRRFNGDGEIRRYPGSPWITAEMLRPNDRLMLCELHGSDFPELQKLFRQDRRVHCYAEDGYRFGIGLVPPAERRGLIFMDPSYELADEYDTAMATLRRMHRRFATGTYALWYPILDERRTSALRKAVQESAMRDVLNLELRVAEGKSPRGMYGCGMILVNPPWTLRDAMELALPYLAKKMGRSGDFSYRIELWSAE